MKSEKEMHKQYDEYLINHIQNVKNGLEWMKLSLFDKLNIKEKDFRDLIDVTIENHDESKYSEEEYIPYMYYFYSEEQNKWLDRFNHAWLHHIHNNPHHWQHWVLYEDEGNSFALDMPMHYIIEMICDWWAFSWSSNNLYEIFDWYKEHRDKQLMSLNTRMIVDTILDMMKEELDNGK